VEFTTRLIHPMPWLIRPRSREPLLTALIEAYERNSKIRHEKGMGTCDAERGSTSTSDHYSATERGQCGSISAVDPLPLCAEPEFMTTAEAGIDCGEQERNSVRCSINPRASLHRMRAGVAARRFGRDARCRGCFSLLPMWTRRASKRGDY
jgi:hypothetical protein